MHVVSYSFLCNDDTTEKLVFQTLHGDGEVNDGGSRGDLGSVRRVRQFSCDVQLETIHYVNLFIAHFHLQRSSQFDEVLFKDIVQCWIIFD